LKLLNRLYDITWFGSVKRFMKSINWHKPGYASITCSTISNILYNLFFTAKYNDSSILITILSCDYLNLSLADEHVGDVTIPTQVIEYSQNCLQDQPIRLQYSNQIKLFPFIVNKLSKKRINPILVFDSDLLHQVQIRLALEKRELKLSYFLTITY
jgi:hypothetical protein